MRCERCAELNTCINHSSESFQNDLYCERVKVELFQNSPVGQLVAISGSSGECHWDHYAFVPDTLAEAAPELSSDAYRRVADARAALAGLDATAARLPNPRLFRHSALRLEAQSTAALEGTYEPLDKVLIAKSDEPRDAQDVSMREVLNYLHVAKTAFAWEEEGRPWSPTALSALQKELVAGTNSERDYSGLRPVQVVIGRRDDATPDETAVKAARFVPPPPGPDLQARLGDLLDWVNRGRRNGIDPVVGAAMVHYTFEALHPFHDGNGRIGRLLIVLNLRRWGVLREPTLTVSPWFEARRQQYYDALLGVSTHGDWATWVGFFADGLAHSAAQTEKRMLALTDVRTELKSRIDQSRLRSANAHALVDLAISSPTFTVRNAAEHLSIQNPGAKRLIDSLMELDILRPVDDRAYARRFHSPEVLRVLLG